MVNFTVNFSPRDIMQRFDRNLERALFNTAEQIIKDSNFYCKEDTGTLKDSALSNSRPEDGVIMWATPYAARQYGYPGAHTDKNPNARAKWFEAAADTRMQDWITVFDRSYRGVSS